MRFVKSLSLVIVALAVSAWGCKDCSCESQCFSTGDRRQARAFGHIKSIMNRLKVGRLLASPEIESTIFHFDGSHPSFQSFLYQRRLAAIAALTLPVDKECNPSMVLNYQDWGAWAWLPTGCLDKCTTATYLSNLANIPAAGGGTNPLGTSCLFASFVAANFPCRIDTRAKTYHVAFMNDDIQTPAFPCFAANARAAVKIGTVNTPNPPLESIPQLGIQTEATTENLDASTKILTCIQEQCCGNRQLSMDMPSEGRYTFLQTDDRAPKIMKLDTSTPLMEALAKETFNQEQFFAKKMGQTHFVKPDFLEEVQKYEGSKMAQILSSGIEDNH